MQSAVKIHLSEKSYKMMESINFKEFSDYNLDIRLIPEEKAFETTAPKDVEDYISETAAVHGLSNGQQTVTEYGRELYALYDEIYDAIH